MEGPRERIGRGRPAERRKIQLARMWWMAIVILALLPLAAFHIPAVIAGEATPAPSAATAAELTALYAGPGVVFRAPENCVGGPGDPYADPAILAFCAVKDVVGALGGPTSGAAAEDFVVAPNRFVFRQPRDCDTVGAIADGIHDGCAVVTGAATLLRDGLPVRLFGVCGRARASDCAVLGTIADPRWKPDGVFLLLDPARVTVHCQYAQDAGRNGCNAGGAYTAGQDRPLCVDDANDPMCEYGADDLAAMLAAYTAFCTDDAANCLENQLEAQWSLNAVIAIGFMNRGDRAWECEDARAKAERFTTAVNAAWATNLPLVQVFIDVARNDLRFAAAADGCASPPRE